MLQTETQLAYAQLVVACSLLGRNAVLSFTLRHSYENTENIFANFLLESFQILNFEQTVSQ